MPTPPKPKVSPPTKISELLRIEACGPEGKQRRLRPRDTRAFRERFDLPPGTAYSLTGAFRLHGSGQQKTRTLDVVMEEDGTIPLRQTLVRGLEGAEPGATLHLTKLKRSFGQSEAQTSVSIEGAASEREVRLLDRIFDRLNSVRASIRSELDYTIADGDPWVRGVYVLSSHSKDEDLSFSLTLPLDAAGRLDSASSCPLQFRAKWDGEEYFGEVQAEPTGDAEGRAQYALIGYGEEDMITGGIDLLGVRISACTSFTLYTDGSEPWTDLYITSRVRVV